MKLPALKGGDCGALAGRHDRLRTDLTHGQPDRIQGDPMVLSKEQKEVSIDEEKGGHSQ